MTGPDVPKPLHRSAGTSAHVWIGGAVAAWPQVGLISSCGPLLVWPSPRVALFSCGPCVGVHHVVSPFLFGAGKPSLGCEVRQSTPESLSSTQCAPRSAIRSHLLPLAPGPSPPKTPQDAPKTLQRRSQHTGIHTGAASPGNSSSPTCRVGSRHRGTARAAGPGTSLGSG
jgi:hypothetical protein